MNEEIRDLTPEEVAAMFVYAEDYAAQNLGAIAFYKNLPTGDRELIKNMVREILKAKNRASRKPAPTREAAK